MKHIHLDLHVNMHVIGTVIVSSLTVISLAALEYVHLNSALAYEKQAIYSQFTYPEPEIGSPKNTGNTGVYSDEVSLTSAKELSKETIEEKVKMKKAFVKILKSEKNSNFTKKVDNLSTEQKMLILERIENKILELASQDISNVKIDKRLGHLLAAKELFMEQ